MVKKITLIIVIAMCITGGSVHALAPIQLPKPIKEGTFIVPNKAPPMITINYNKENGYTVFYTTDGQSDPMTEGIEYQNGIPFTEQSITLKAVTKQSSSYSAIVEQKYSKIVPKCGAKRATIKNAKKGSKVLKGKLGYTGSLKVYVSISIKEPKKAKKTYKVYPKNKNWTLKLKKKLVKNSIISVKGYALEKRITFSKRGTTNEVGVFVYAPIWRSTSLKVK